MTTTNLVHIALGSNQGDRLEYLQRAVDAIHATIGAVVSIARIYQTPAWGFEGADFLNTCIAVKSTYATATILEKLLEIETSIGRIRTPSKQYEGRVIDLDIIFSSEGVFDTQTLIVPHPLMQDRKFVLLPMVDIARKMLHPKLQVTVQELLSQTSDVSQIHDTDLVLRYPRVHYNFAELQYMAIEGGIGSGKTTLVHMVAEEFNGKLLLERFADNPFLPKFYKEPDRYAFQLELSFLADRYQQHTDAIAQLDLFKDFVISDYHVFKSSIFAQVTLAEEEFRLYKKLFDITHREIASPDQYIYLYQSIPRLLANIKKRGRKYEQDITAEYLTKIHQGYMDFIKANTALPIKIIDITDRDFVRNREDYIWVIEQMNP